MTAHDLDALTAELVRAHNVIDDVSAERDRLRAERDRLRAALGAFGVGRGTAARRARQPAGDVVTAAQLVVAGFALWGAWDLGGRLLAWVERSSDLGDLDDHARRRRALGDVTKGGHRGR